MDGGRERWMDGLREGRMDRWMVGWMAACLLAGWLGGGFLVVGWLGGGFLVAGWLVAAVWWLGGWVAGWLVGWLVGWLAGWLAGWMDGLGLCFYVKYMEVNMYITILLGFPALLVW